jgi:two-component system chemotaxis response regulator CheB
MANDTIARMRTDRSPVAVSRDIVVIGTSAGGMAALNKIATALPADFPGSVFIVMHLSPESLGGLPDFLAKAGPLPAAHAHDGEPVKLGRIYVAPPDCHLIVGADRLRVTRGPKENRFRPAVDPLFHSAALAFGPRVAGVVLTGYLDDGTAGLAAIKRAGGIAIVQDPIEAEAPYMPRSALRHVKVDHCVKLAEIAPLLVKLATTAAAVGEASREGKMPKEFVIETEIATDDQVAAMRVRELGEASMFTCPECHGALIRLRDHSPLRFRCHTGHAFTADSLVAALTESVEDSLWGSVRSLQEQAMLLNHLSDHESKSEERTELRLRSQEVLRRADLVRQALLSTVPVPARDAEAAVTVDAVVSTDALD